MPTTGPSQPLPQPSAQEYGHLKRKLEALEDYATKYLGLESDTQEMRLAARTIVDIIRPDMSAEEKAAAFLLINYVKRREAESISVATGQVNTSSQPEPGSTQGGEVR